MLEKRTLEQVKRITNEVKELHPLLSALFPKLPTIIKCEYKQGNREAGADFVLTKQDPVWLQEEYVGVVVKVGKISSNSTDVQMQIDQCITMKRSINGKKEILVNEVWVVSSAGVTQNAQDYFSQKFNNHKIKFIGPEDITKMMVAYLPEYFEGISIPINQYMQRTRNSLEQLQASTKLWLNGLDNVNINHELIFQSNRKYTQNDTRIIKAQNVQIDTLIEKGGVSLIEGAIGSGKSSLLRSTAIKLLDSTRFQEKRQLPIYIQFKDLEKKYGFSLEKLIADEIHSDKSDDIKYIVMIDGIDESNHELDERIGIINKIVAEASPMKSVKLILTCRSNDKTLFRTKLPTSVRNYQIAPLSMKQIIGIINMACQQLNTKNRIIEDLKKSSLFKSLPKTPIAAILLAKLLNENNQEIPSNLTELYSKYTEIALGRWDIEKELAKEKDFDATEAITKNIAKYFFENDLLVISKDEARNFFKEYLSKRKMGVDHNSLFDHVCERSEIFYSDDTNSTFGFRHRTFIEFFYAKYLLSSDSFEISDKCFEANWLAVSFFWTGLQKDCPGVLRDFALSAPSEEKSKVLKMINMGNILLAGYSTEYKVITSALAQTFSEAGVYFSDIVKTGKTSIFSSFSEMKLLSLLRYVMADSYGYEFFTDAIEEAMVLIDENNDLEDIHKMYALFFLQTSLVSPSIENLFEHLIEKYKEALPMSIALGIAHETRNLDMKNKFTAKVMRYLRKVTQDRDVQQHINFLYERPIKQLLNK
ncbi:energy-coupling factor transporter ATP-binding protein EcfA2 [Rheinheimera pacifica]|uniref:NACHT domain-containing protein n=1 Tax=Rheinheimera pacifica TaxID=173990 RepID=UPI0021684C0D|nr:NACHT domain-containing protein [Rheinheimera pacifica]MCS4306090.1 energy-coupling factor transporter ATP-binding protein EcfA2 [Rheinheimera pacifica]